MPPEQTPLWETLQSEEESLRALIKDRPKNGRAMAKLACLLEQQAKLKEDPPATEAMRQEALEWAYRSVKVAPEKPFGYMSLSILEEDYTKRVKALRKALQFQTFDDSAFARLVLLIRLLLDPKQHEARQVVGKIGKASKNHPSKRVLNTEEEHLYEQIVQGLDGFWAKKSGKLAVNLQEISMKEYCLGLFFRKRFPLQMNQLRSKRHLHKAVLTLPDNHDNIAAAEFWLGTLGHKKVDRCPASYIVRLYSTFASQFDELLMDKLNYQTPTMLRKLLDESISHPFDRGLDLGCGTGLSGIAFRDKIKGELVGVDLSPEMINKAKERQCYDSLQVEDVTTFLADKQNEAYLHFDLIFACDVFVYLGDLSGVFQSAHGTLSKEGIFAFSTELLEEQNSTDDYVLHKSARFAHSRDYIERLANSANTPFEVIKLLSRSIRKNEGKDVVGLLTILKKID